MERKKSTPKSQSIPACASLNHLLFCGFLNTSFHTIPAFIYRVFVVTTLRRLNHALGPNLFVFGEIVFCLYRRLLVVFAVIAIPRECPLVNVWRIGGSVLAIDSQKWIEMHLDILQKSNENSGASLSVFRRNRLFCA